ncbi:hypothetical protein [Ornithinimicrobium kibberense]|uniref:hypothetical protein n=1 Tax=Ornithinimicrobium kibberense TaxID=282060 RepID=UPI003617495B
MDDHDRGREREEVVRRPVADGRRGDPQSDDQPEKRRGPPRSRGEAGQPGPVLVQLAKQVGGVGRRRGGSHTRHPRQFLASDASHLTQVPGEVTPLVSNPGRAASPPRVRGCPPPHAR